MSSMKFKYSLDSIREMSKEGAEEETQKNGIGERIKGRLVIGIHIAFFIFCK